MKDTMNDIQRSAVNHDGPNHGGEGIAGDAGRDRVPGAAPANNEPVEVEPVDMPFGAPASGRRRVIMLALFGALAVAALLIVHLATRGEGDAAGDMAGHNHGAGPASDSAMPVMLTPDRAERIGVTYAPVALGTLETEVRTVAQVTFDETRVEAISPKIDGWVEALYVNYTGQSVERGQPLLAVYSPMLVTAQEELLLAGKLSADVAAGTPEARSGAAALRESARRRLAFWDIPASAIERIERTGEVQKTLVLRSPTSGIVIEKAVLNGQRIMAGDALYRVADLSTVWLEGEVFERDLPGVRLGQQVTATFEALPGEERRGQITYVYPTLNPETRTARVRVALPNPALTLKPGMYATIHIRGGSDRPVLSVPRSALLATGTRNLVFVRQPDGMLVPRDVVPGATSTDRVEIVEGLTVGDTVVASATFLVDAESNLGSALGGMENMPGMDMGSPSSGTPKGGAPGAPGDHSGHPVPAAPAAPSGAAKSPPRAAPMPDMPGMDHSRHEE